MPPRPLTLALTAGAGAGAALLARRARRALRRRVAHFPLWPLPALPEPVSGRGGGSSPSRARRVTVTERTTPAEGVVRLRLAGDGPDGLPPWRPGAHLDLVLPSGLVRQYSLCGDVADSAAYTVAVRLAENGRGGSREIHERLHPGTEVEIRGPRDRFPLVPSPAYHFVAGGIGITPLLPMLYAAEAAGARWRLLYCGRSRASMPFLAEIAALGGDRVTVVAGDESGRPELGFLASLPKSTAVYCCGPGPLMDAVAGLLPKDRPPRLERFTGGGPGDGGPFEVELSRSGRTVPVAAGQSVLAAVLTELPDLAHSCRQGFCGTCRQRVLAGEVDHRDELLTDAERTEQMLICVSRCHGGGRLVLDL
ncbi:PDR/VanB family oxidoreductase [Streptomyces amakusaensis]|uniref:PDR/VanB family oxidoreductase n=1 Tax=Streptomyces amakusaensis TaxID=67271 RepID=A0ABW0AC26_9ACTN